MNKEYSPYWKDLGTAVMYKSPDFIFKPYAVILELENCLIKKIYINTLYHNIAEIKEVKIYNEEFMKSINAQSQYYSIIILGNHIMYNSLNKDIIKKKLELFIERCKFPVLALFALVNNNLSKPHTGMWNLLNKYYVHVGKKELQKAIFISDNAGRIIENDKKIIKYDRKDTDRAFAHNINIPFYTINEYLDDNKKEKFNWNIKCLPKECRSAYIDKLSAYKNPDILEVLKNKGYSSCYMILLYGAPRSGKTTLAKKLIREWGQKEYNKTCHIVRLGTDKYSNKKRFSTCIKMIKDRISVIIDGNMHTKELRQPYIDLAEEHNIKYVIIEINAGYSMAYIFNHVAVELATDEKTILYPEKVYDVYKCSVNRPENVLLYTPEIIQKKEIMEYRY
jgi:DNA 3'-phosphatase